MDKGEKRSRGRPRNTDGPQQIAGVQSLERAIAIMEVVAEGEGLSLSEVAEATGLPASTAYRILVTFQGHGMVEFNDVRQLWYVGVTTFRMGASFIRRRKLAEHGRGVMRRLQVATGETANLAIADAEGVVFVSQVETHQPIRAFFRPGTRGDYHSSGVGKAILAFADEKTIREITDRNGLAPYTEHTHRDVNTLLADLATIRARGWSVDDEERNDGMRCVAAPIFNEYGEPIAAISVSGPSVRVTPAIDAQFGALVLDAALEMTAQYGGMWPGSDVSNAAASDPDPA